MTGTSEEKTVKITEILEYTETIKKICVEDTYWNFILLALFSLICFSASFCTLHLLLMCGIITAIIASGAVTIFVAIQCFESFIATSRSFQLLQTRDGNRALLYAK